MKWFLIFAGALALVIVSGLHLQSRMEDTRLKVQGLCQSTRGGEPWPVVQSRAQERGLTFEKASGSKQIPAEFLTSSGFAGKRYGCLVRVENDRVVDTRFEEMAGW